MGSDSMILVRVDGVWGYSDGHVVAEIFDQQIHWLSGQKTALIPDGRGGFEISLRGVTHTAELMPDLRIKWSNGDIWAQLSSFPEQSGQNKPTETRQASHAVQTDSFAQMHGSPPTSRAPAQSEPTFRSSAYPVQTNSPRHVYGTPTPTSRAPAQSGPTFRAPAHPAQTNSPRHVCGTPVPTSRAPAQSAQPCMRYVYEAPVPTSTRGVPTYCDSCPECNRTATRIAPTPTYCDSCPECNRTATRVAPTPTCSDSCPECNRTATRVAPTPTCSGSFSECNRTVPVTPMQYGSPPTLVVPQAHQPRSIPAPPEEHLNFGQYHSYNVEHEVKYDLPPTRRIVHHFPAAHIVEHCYEPDCTANGAIVDENELGELHADQYRASPSPQEQEELHYQSRDVQHVNHQPAYHEKTYSELNHEAQYDLPPSKTVLHHFPQFHEYEHCYDHRISPENAEEQR